MARHAPTDEWFILDLVVKFFFPGDTFKLRFIDIWTWTSSLLELFPCSLSSSAFPHFISKAAAPSNLSLACSTSSVLSLRILLFRKLHSLFSPRICKDVLSFVSSAPNFLKQANKAVLVLATCAHHLCLGLLTRVLYRVRICHCNCNLLSDFAITTVFLSFTAGKDSLHSREG